MQQLIGKTIDARKAMKFIGFLLFAVAVFSTVNSSVTFADTFNAGKIIDDAIFTNKGSMDTSQIQAFLNSKVPTCDSAGAQTSEYGGGTRSQWAQAKYGQSTFTCLKDYSENGRSAAQIIYDTAQAYSINPQVLIVLLQKEQGLVTDTWPLNIQYRSATGYGCPDTAPCDTQYYGLTNQLDWSGKMFRAIINASSNWYTPYILGNNTIRYNPNASCGSSVVNVQNRSTQALYNYTPYQPNAAAIAAPLGSTVNCGAYGNINFFRYFNSWFGSTSIVSIPGCTAATNTNVNCIWNYSTPLSQNIYTASYGDLTQKVSNGAQYQNNNFLAINPVSPNPGNVPVYQLQDGAGSTFLTTNTAERSALIGAGYANQGIGFYADPAGSNSGYPVYRLYSSSATIHVWTNDVIQRQSLLSSGYTDEGTAFTSVSPVRRETAPGTGKQLTYRFYIPQTLSHLWTNSVYERDTLINAGYNYEGVSWQSSSSSSDLPVYRLLSKLTGEHLYTIAQSERDSLAGSGAWVDEGTSLYVSPTTTGQPLYRLYAPSIKRHFLTTSSHERDVLLSGNVWTDEGIAWYLP